MDMHLISYEILWSMSKCHVREHLYDLKTGNNYIIGFQAGILILFPKPSTIRVERVIMLTVSRIYITI